MMGMILELEMEKVAKKMEFLGGLEAGLSMEKEEIRELKS
jgi:hypothetical protein